MKAFSKYILDLKFEDNFKVDITIIKDDLV